MIFQISDYYKLLALHKALMEAKFSSATNDEAIAGSSYVAEIANQVVDALIQAEIEREEPDAAQRWNDWRQIDSNRREWFIALERAYEANSWPSWGFQDKERYSKILLSPFQVDEILLERFIELVNKNF